MNDMLPEAGLFRHQLAGSVSGNGAHALLLHGGLLDHRLFDALVPLLTPARRCVAPDLPGFGGSPPADGPLGLEMLAADVLAFMDGAGIERADFLGVSLGAGVALHIGAMAPTRVGSIALMSCSAKPGGGTGAGARAELLGSGMEVIAERFAKHMTGAQDPPGMRERIESMARGTSPATAAALFDLIGRYPGLEDVIGETAQPLLFIHGTADPAIAGDDQCRLAAMARDGDIATLSGAGHLPVLSHPRACADAILAFWQHQE